jgi:hypothetical protein
LTTWAQVILLTQPPDFIISEKKEEATLPIWIFFQQTESHSYYRGEDHEFLAPTLSPTQAVNISEVCHSQDFLFVLQTLDNNGLFFKVSLWRLSRMVHRKVPHKCLPLLLYKN